MDTRYLEQMGALIRENAIRNLAGYCDCSEGGLTITLTDVKGHEHRHSLPYQAG